MPLIEILSGTYSSIERASEDEDVVTHVQRIKSFRVATYTDSAHLVRFTTCQGLLSVFLLRVA